MKEEAGTDFLLVTGEITTGKDTKEDVDGEEKKRVTKQDEEMLDSLSVVVRTTPKAHFSKVLASERYSQLLAAYCIWSKLG